MSQVVMFLRVLDRDFVSISGELEWLVGRDKGCPPCQESFRSLLPRGLSLSFVTKVPGCRELLRWKWRMRVCLQPARMKRIRHRSQLSKQSPAGVTYHCNTQVAKPSTALNGCCPPSVPDTAMLVTPNALSLHCSLPA